MKLRRERANTGHPNVLQDATNCDKLKSVKKTSKGVKKDEITNPVKPRSSVSVNGIKNYGFIPVKKTGANSACDENQEVDCKFVDFKEQSPNVSGVRQTANILKTQNGDNSVKAKRAARKNSKSKNNAVSLESGRDKSVCAKSKSSKVIGNDDAVFVKPSSNNLISAKNKIKSEKRTNTKSFQSIRKNQNLKEVPYDCYGFNDSLTESDICYEPYNGELTAFDPSKPYRVALYVRPSKRLQLDSTLLKKCQAFNASMNITNGSCVNKTVGRSRLNSELTLKSPGCNKWSMPMTSTPKEKRKLLQTKITELLQPSPKRAKYGNEKNVLQPISDSSECSDETMILPVSPDDKGSPNALEDHTDEKKHSHSDSSSSEISPQKTIQSTCFRKPSRRSYVKKIKAIAPMEDEPSSDEILNSIEKTKTKKRKIEKQDKEFEKWSRSMNSQFDEVDKFEISFD